MPPTLTATETLLHRGFSGIRVSRDSASERPFSATAGSITLYLDGATLGTNSGTVAHLPMTFDQIGTARATGRTLMPSATVSANNWFYFTGLLDDFYFYNTAL